MCDPFHINPLTIIIKGKVSFEMQNKGGSYEPVYREMSVVGILFLQVIGGHMLLCILRFHYIQCKSVTTQRMIIPFHLEIITDNNRDLSR